MIVILCDRCGEEQVHRDGDYCDKCWKRINEGLNNNGWGNGNDDDGNNNEIPYISVDKEDNHTDG